MIVGDTVNGDELIFHPGTPDRLFVLPVEKEQIFEAGSDLLAAVEWTCASGKLTKRFTERNFEPFDSRKQKKRPVASAATTQSGSKDTLDETVAALQKWVERHGLVKAAQKHFKEWLDKQTEPLIGMDMKVVRKDKVKVKLKEHVLILPDKYPVAAGPDHTLSRRFRDQLLFRSVSTVHGPRWDNPNRRGDAQSRAGGGACQVIFGLEQTGAGMNSGVEKGVSSEAADGNDNG